MRKFWMSVLAVLATVTVAQAQPYYYVNLQAQSGHYVVAEWGGYDVVNANRGSAGAWETFELLDFNGGTLESGDLVRIKVYSGHYLNVPSCTATFGNSQMTATGGGSSCSWFWVDKYDSNDTLQYGTISSGDQVALLHYDSGQYASADSGGGSYVSVDRGWVYSWERFYITF
jgi:hypothetical protein